MKYFNWLVQKIFYKHTVTSIPSELVISEDGILYDVEYENQVHANLCSAACVCMIERFLGKPFFSLDKNPYGILDPYSISEDDYESSYINIEITKAMVGSKYEEICVANLKETVKKDLKADLLKKGPMMLTLSMNFGYAHSVLLIGIQGDDLFYHDPLTHSDLKMSIDELIKNRVYEMDDTILREIEYFSRKDLPSSSFLKSKEIKGLYKKQNFIKSRNKVHFLRANNHTHIDRAILEVLGLYAQPKLISRFIGESYKEDKKRIRDFLSKTGENQTISLHEITTYIESIEKDVRDPNLKKIFASILYYTNSDDNQPKRSEHI